MKTLVRFIKIVVLLIKEARNLHMFKSLSDEKRLKSNIPKNLVEILIELGPVFVKLGQILSTRPDFVPKEYINELKVLHNQVPPFSFADIEKTIKEEFGKELTDSFQSFDKEPVASASLSQVHFALLHDGTEVAVKIQRSGIKEVIEKDLLVLSWLIWLAGKLYPRLTRNLNLSAAFREFEKYTKKELNFTLEGKTLDRFRDNFKDWDDVLFPEVYWEHTTDRILTMERVSGLHVDEVRANLSLESREKLNKRLVEMEMKMFVTDAFFHADLHPGNIFFKEDGKIVVIDVGMFGELTDEQRDRFLLYWLAIVEKEKKRAFSHLTKLGWKMQDVDETGFYIKFSDILDEFYSSSITKRSLTKTYLEIFANGAKFGFVFPSELLLQAKALTTGEALAFILVPEFRFAEEVRPIVVKELGKRAKPDELKSHFAKTFPEWLLLGELTEKHLLSEESDSREVWKEVAGVWAKECDQLREKDKEIIHGEFAVVINESLERVFNFVTRFAQYPFWHPTYTEASKVIHVSARYVFITPEVLGSVFRLDEIVDGNNLINNGEITEFERNKLYKWRAPMSMFPLIDIGTCFSFEDLGDGRTRLHEYFYFIDNPIADFFTARRWFSKEALTEHIREELTGVKTIIETGNYQAEDMEYLWEDTVNITRLIRVDDVDIPLNLPTTRA
ncbi:MAG: AarF/UbiB family protein [Bacillota bacterium]|nr:AarF/UbiB family protein [Bacillota bacterium]